MIIKAFVHKKLKYILVFFFCLFVFFVVFYNISQTSMFFSMHVYIQMFYSWNQTSSSWRIYVWCKLWILCSQLWSFMPFYRFCFSINDNIFVSCLCYSKTVGHWTCVRSVLQEPALSSGRQLATSDAIDQLHESGTTSK